MPAHPGLSEKDKAIINKKNIQDSEIVCALCNSKISSEKDIEYHNFNPYSFGEKPGIDKLVPVCKNHHRELGQLSVKEFLALKEMEIFFSNSLPRRLDDVIVYKAGFVDPGELFDTSSVSNNSNSKFSICPSTGLEFFYAVIPVKYINNDNELQPRPLEFKRLWDIYRHLLIHSQLAPSVCRLAESKIYLFDGQHKAAAQIWAGRMEIECKVYINPNIKMLKETNLIAHDKLRQMPFFTSILINKWASIFNEEWKDYMEKPGGKSEAGFVSFLSAGGKKRQDAICMIESNIYDSILEDKSCKIKKYVEESRTAGKKPLTVSRLKQSFFKKFITSPPLVIDIEESDRLRELERKNNIRLLNMLVFYSLENKSNSSSGNENGRISERIYLNGAFKVVCSIIKDMIATILQLFDENERKEILLRQISNEEWEMISKGLELLFSHRVWPDDSEENYNNLRQGNEAEVRKYLSKRGLSANWIINNLYRQQNSFID